MQLASSRFRTARQKLARTQALDARQQSESRQSEEEIVLLSVDKTVPAMVSDRALLLSAQRPLLSSTTNNKATTSELSNAFTLGMAGQNAHGRNPTQRTRAVTAAIRFNSIRQGSKRKTHRTVHRPRPPFSTPVAAPAAHCHSAQRQQPATIEFVVQIFQRQKELQIFQLKQQKLQHVGHLFEFAEFHLHVERL